MSGAAGDISMERSASASSLTRVARGMKAVAKQILGKDTRVLLRRLRYSGGKYQCNVCGNRVRTMFTAGLPFPVLRELDVIGGETRENDICPICFSNCRARLLFEYIRRETDAFGSSRRSKVLHVAPEYGILSRMRDRETIDYLGVDLNPPTSSEGAEITCCDITAIDHPADSFDLIICSHVEHIPTTVSL